MARIVLVTIGSLGDIHPFIAIGRALVAQGQQVVLAVPEDAVAKVRAAGLDAAHIMPSFATICDRLGMTEEQAAAEVMANTSFVVDEILLPALQTSAAALDELVEGADILVSSIFAFAADLVAEKHRLPLASIVLQPMTLFSAWHPPVAPRFGMMRHHPQSSFGRGWNRLFYAMMRAALRRLHAPQINAVRAAHGLAPTIAAPMLDHSSATQAVLCCWSSALSPLPPDAPSNAALVGFPFFDSENGTESELAPELASFLSEGEPPLIFTLGSFAVASAGNFYEEAALAARALNMRAVMLTGKPGPPRLDDQCLFMNYAPHSAVFPHAAAIIHHGGIGTTGQALRAGRPQLIIPHFGDQFDNAARLQAAVLALTASREEFDRTLGASTISRLLTDRAIANAANRAARKITSEDGGMEAARRIVNLCPNRGQSAGRP